MRPNAKLMKASLTGALGGLLYGFDTVVISGIIDSVTRLYGLSPRGISLSGSVAMPSTCAQLHPCASVDSPDS